MAQILIVDDCQDTLQSMAMFLENTSNHVVTCASNGREALSLLLEQLPDVILLDLAMPEMSGVAFLQTLRSRLGTLELPVVVLTGYSERPIIDSAIALNATTILTKGTTTPVEILQALEKACKSAPG